MHMQIAYDPQKANNLEHAQRPHAIDGIARPQQHLTLHLCWLT
jgi:hypothetical protein